MLPRLKSISTLCVAFFTNSGVLLLQRPTDLYNSSELCLIIKGSRPAAGIISPSNAYFILFMGLVLITIYLAQIWYRTDSELGITRIRRGS